MPIVDNVDEDLFISLLYTEGSKLTLALQKDGCLLTQNEGEM